LSRVAIAETDSRNGTTPKTLHTEVGPVGLDVPRDRTSSFELRLVPKGSRRLGGGLAEMIVSLYAGGMTVRDIGHHLHHTVGVELSQDTISKITDAVLEEVKVNHPGFDAHLLCWEGGIHAEQVRRADQGQGGSFGHRACRGL
jgi:transposase-like protein